MSVSVQLSHSELLLGAIVGVMRQAQNVEAGRPPRDGGAGSPGAPSWQNHIEGALGELVVAKALNRFWSGSLGRLRADDVGAYQVRTARRPGGLLCLHPQDPDDKVFILVTAGRTEGAYTVVGWLRASEGKRPEYWTERIPGRGPSFFVPQSALRGIERLPEELAQAGLRIAREWWAALAEEGGNGNQDAR